MLRVDPFITYAYCCRICQLEFFTVFFIVFEIPVDKCKSFTRMLQYGHKRFTDKIFKNSYNRSPLAFHFFITLCATEAIVWDPFFCGPIISVSFRLIKPRPQATLRVLFLQVLLAGNRMQHLMCREEFCNLLHYHCVVVLFAVPGELSFTVSWFMIGFN